MVLFCKCQIKGVKEGKIPTTKVPFRTGERHYVNDSLQSYSTQTDFFIFILFLNKSSN